MSNGLLTDDLQKVTYNLKAAHEFYRKFIYNTEHQAALTKLGFHVAGSIAPKNWEAYGALLTGDKVKVGYGADLQHHEVKSAKVGSSFEYQYHFNGGRAKLLDDMVVNHIFVSYSEDYKDIDVRLITGETLKPKFEAWLPGLIKNYEGPNRKLRYRKQIAYGFVKKNGLLILSTKDGNLV